MVLICIILNCTKIQWAGSNRVDLINHVDNFKALNRTDTGIFAEKDC